MWWEGGIGKPRNKKMYPLKCQLLKVHVLLCLFLVVLLIEKKFGFLKIFCRMFKYAWKQNKQLDKNLGYGHKFDSLGIL